ncbi:MAG: pyridoxamine 5'-phosphate oxidase family protein [Thermodesulforhabdaceae bacterium]
MKELKDYFENHKGIGVLATADDKGVVNVAIFARPHFFEDDTLGFIMPDRLTHNNLQKNPHAAYLFMEEGPGYKGKRLILKKVSEVTDKETILAIKRKFYPDDFDKELFLVKFEVTKVLPLVGV